MGITELRLLGLADPVFDDQGNDGQARRALDLVHHGASTRDDIAHARTVQKNCKATLDRILLSEGLVSRQALLDVHAKTCKSRRLTSTELV